MQQRNVWEEWTVTTHKKTYIKDHYNNNYINKRLQIYMYII
jgi:hypothetical protein